MFIKVICALILSGFVFLQADDISKVAIVKLINKDKVLTIKIAKLETEIKELRRKVNSFSVCSTQKNKNTKEYSLVFVPSYKSFVRNRPSRFGKIKSMAITPNKYPIFKIVCYPNAIGYWGKSQKGWIYISNPKYGSLYNNKNKKIDMDYSKICNQYK